MQVSGDKILYIRLNVGLEIIRLQESYTMICITPTSARLN